MILKALFGQRKCRYEGEYAPELLVCWDEYCIDENPTEFEKEIEQTKKDLKEDFTSFVVVDIVVDNNAIKSFLNKNPVIKGKII